MDYYLHCGDSSLKKDDFLLNKYYTVKGNHDDEDFQSILFQKLENIAV